MPPELRKPLTAEATFTGRMPAHPTGCAVCEVEVDPETGAIEVTRYASVDDAGQPINPLVLHGQVHGGIVQGLGQALTETVAYDDDGQVLNASFMDYAMPRADSVPAFDVALAEDPTGGNALRVKGGGEAGITPALAAAINAVVDALVANYGVKHIEMPATPATGVGCAIRRYSNDRRSLDLDLRGLLDQPGDLHHRHRRIMRADRLAIGAAELLAGSRDIRRDRSRTR